MKALSRKLTIPATVIIMLFVIKLMNPVLHDPDFYWHLKTGEYIVSHFSVPKSDPFAYTSKDMPWVAHEWLSEVILYGVQHVFGMTGIRVLVALLCCATFLLVYGFSKKFNANKMQALIISLLLFAPVLPYGVPRPQIFSYFFFAAFLCILLDFKYYSNSRKLFLLPLLMLLWANMHAGYLVGIALMLMVTCAEWIKYFVLQNGDITARNKLIRLNVVIVACIAVVNINPQFVEIWRHPFYLISMEANHSFIEEWASPNFHTTFYKYYLVIVIAYFSLLSFSTKKPDLLELGLPIFFITSSFVSQRHLPLACLTLVTMVSVFYPHLAIPTVSNWIGRYNSRMSRVAASHISDTHLPILNMMLIAIMSALAIYVEVNVKNNEVAYQRIPVAATEYLIKNNITGNMFNDYNYGGYLIYRLAPKQKVFIDGRSDMYGDAFIDDYKMIYTGSTGWKEKFDEYGINFVICNKESTLRKLLIANGEFQETYSDQYHSVLLKKEKKFESLLVSYKQQ